MRTIGTLFFFLAVLMTVFVTANACASNTTKVQIIGTWQKSDGKILVSFFQDDTVVLKLDDNIGDTLIGTYMFTGDKTVKMDFPTGGPYSIILIWTVNINDEQMTVGQTVDPRTPITLWNRVR